MNKSEREAVSGIRALWPYLGPLERLEWVERLRGLFLGDWNETTAVLSGRVLWPPET